MILFRQLIHFRCLSACSPELDETVVFRRRLILDAAPLKKCAAADSNQICASFGLT